MLHYEKYMNYIHSLKIYINYKPKKTTVSSRPTFNCSDQRPLLYLLIQAGSVGSELVVTRILKNMLKDWKCIVKTSLVLKCWVKVQEDSKNNVNNNLNETAPLCAIVGLCVCVCASACVCSCACVFVCELYVSYID